MKGSTASEATRLRIELTTAEQDDRPIYITGNFNAWRVDQAEFCLQRRENGSYHLDFLASLLPMIRTPSIWLQALLF
ncbi:MAG: hypothetical protein AAF146_18855, partial [Bacteroidota bacterium]